MKKVPIEFDCSFESDEILPIPVGRIYLDSYVVRLIFCPDGKVRLYIPKGAVDIGHVIVYDDEVDEPFGFLPKKGV